MVDATNNIPVTSEKAASASSHASWLPFDSLRREVDRLFDDFGDGWFKGSPSRRFDFEPLFRRQSALKVPAVDIVEKAGAFELTAEIPGLNAEDVEVTLRNGNIVIKGEKQEETKEETKDYHLHERHFGSFERVFGVPEGVDPNKIDAQFNNGVLRITLPKTAAAQKPEKKITVRSAGN